MRINWACVLCEIEMSGIDLYGEMVGHSTSDGREGAGEAR